VFTARYEMDIYSYLMSAFKGCNIIVQFSRRDLKEVIQATVKN
jgi:hypothetical protein